MKNPFAAILFVVSFGAHASDCLDIATLRLSSDETWKLHSVAQETQDIFLPKPSLPLLEEGLDRVIDFDKLQANLGLLKDVYQAHGYFQVVLKPCLMVHSAEERELDLIVKVELNQRAQIRDIRFRGLKTFTPREIERVMQSQRQTALSDFFITLGYGALQLEEDKARIIEFYQSQGFLDARVASIRVSVSDDLSFCDIDITIDEGNRYIVGNIEPIGSKSESSLYKGGMFDLPRLTEDVETWLLPYRDAGFAFVKAMPELTLNKDVLSVRYGVDKGPRIIVRSILAKGNDYTRSDVITREFSDLQGKAYSYSAVELRRLRLLNRGAFSDAKVSLEPTDIPGVQDLIVRVVEKFPMRFNLSPYYLSGEGFVLSAYAFHQNLFGHGVYALVATQLSSLRQTFELAFFDPRVAHTKLSWLSELHGRQYQYASFASSSLGGGARAGLRVSDYLSFIGGAVFEEVSVDPLVEPSFLLPYAALPLNSARGVAYVGATLEPLAPSLDINQLFALDTKITYAGPASLSDLSFAELALGLRWGFSFSSFVLRGKLGGAALFSLSDQKIAISDRYFLGGQTGANSLRGYQIFSVGPWFVGNSTNPVVQIGGVRKFSGTVEFEFPIMKFLEMRGYLFSDFGNAYSEFSGITNGAIAASAGFGFTANAWRLPLKCEVALPLVNMPGALGLDFYIGLSSINL